MRFHVRHMYLRWWGGCAGAADRTPCVLTGRWLPNWDRPAGANDPTPLYWSTYASDHCCTFYISYFNDLKGLVQLSRLFEVSLKVWCLFASLFGRDAVSSITCSGCHRFIHNMEGPMARRWFDICSCSVSTNARLSHISWTWHQQPSRDTYIVVSRSWIG